MDEGVKKIIARALLVYKENTNRTDEEMLKNFEEIMEQITNPGIEVFGNTRIKDLENLL